MGTAVTFYVVNKEENQKELADNLNKFDDFKSNILLGLGLSIFSTGTFILINILKAKLFNSTVVSSFIDHNLYVSSASNWVNVINHVLYPILVTFIFQGFILNGLTKQIGFKKSSIVTSLFYGFWFGDILGGTIFSLFLNQIYWKTKNIFYPGLVTAIMNLGFILAYLIKNEIWLLKADSPDYNSEIVKGLLITIAMTPIAFKVVRQAIKIE
ncbi:MAG: CPBP family intramembrane metalloprotease [Cyclobacteriaceae bacterium]|nr:CPBP family intramembrane metalloprotease [Cyclobacteriaceae bacterium]